MDARTIIAGLRAGRSPTADQMRWFGKALHSAAITDAQAGAFAMGVCLRGLEDAARVGLTEGMRDSGDVLHWDLDGPVLDKHSTGGVGDPVSLLLAPVLAECGAFVPMISGRGLGHTGGTLDKLEAIPGYISDIGPKRLEHVVREVGCAIIGATGRVAPSDKRLYAIRDVTGTVASIDLITASILSKKLAAGLDGLVLDVKTGSGAFMETPEQARQLADALVAVANGAGCPTTALVTGMWQPLADAAGNAVEIRAVMEVLTGARSNTNLRTVTSGLSVQIMVSSGLSKDTAEAVSKVDAAFDSGAAADRFARLVAAMGGPLDFAESWRNCLPEAPVLREVTAGSAGTVTQIDTRALGETVVHLGGGRLRDGDRIDPAVGVSGFARIGATVTPSTPLAMVHAATENAADRAAGEIRAAYTIGSDPVTEPPLIYGEPAS
ncbi:thymidine phosphorylase [Litoreibacter roseus]|uniref:Thymidine phosphorylase n=1 Tax=Litoreibacter roseus TaxID=2601869 RepID=A0A6N6JHY9_9RHOB|nr:thymidine phosphorylase [Litoreibacter roseus]GFE65440.1 thymidine phosphorylase [Litoreibacter roseus]